MPDADGSAVEQTLLAALAEQERLTAQLRDPQLVAAVVAVGGELIRAFGAAGKVVVFGNGGSAADAGHLAAEFVGRCTRDRGPLPALCLSDSTAAVTAIANDFGYEQVFARQVNGLVSRGDVVIGMTTSGRSPNVLAGLHAAAATGACTVALCGADDSGLRPIVDHCLSVPSNQTARIQETHLMWGHCWAEAVDRMMGSSGEV